GRSNSVLPFQQFALFIELPVVGKNQVGGFTDEKIAVHADPESTQPLDLIHQTHRVNHHTIADDTDLSPAEDPRGNEVKNKFSLSNKDRVARVVPALSTDYDVRRPGQNVNDLSLALVAPLGPD